ncbi:MAG: diacylglycerol kinase family lipid kinase [Bacteroidia bacterium]
MKWFFVVNPQSGGGKAAREWSKIERILVRENLSFEAAFTRSPGDALRLVAEAVEKGFRGIVAVGGDGTVSETANGILIQRKIPSDQILFACIPMGSGNDWARMYGIPRNYEQAIGLLRKPFTFTQDIGRITWLDSPGQQIRYFNNIAGFLFEAFLTEKTLHVDKSGVKGQFVYILALLKYMFRFRASQVTLRGDDFSESGPRLLITVGIGKYNGGGMSLVPRSLPHDGLLDITVADDMPAWEILRNILKIYNGNIYRHPKIRHYRSRSVWIDGDAGLKTEADGELLGTIPVKIDLIPQALCVVVPPSFSIPPSL